MISSESINFTRFPIINENKKQNLSNEENVNKYKRNKNVFKNDLNSLSETIGEDLDFKKLLKTNKKNEINRPINILQPKNEEEITNDLLYRNNIDNINPIYIGRCRAYFYNSEGDPKITIGPDCKY